MKSNLKIAVIGAGNIGLAIARGLVDSKLYKAKNITLTRRKKSHLEKITDKAFILTTDNQEAVNNSDVVIIAVEPRQMDKALNEIKDAMAPERHIVISVVTGVSLKKMKDILGDNINIVRAMPNTSIAIRESMTCMAAENSNGNGEENPLAVAEKIFSTVGKVTIIDEELMGAATALAACGVAFFLRAIRAASQGGIEIGFNSDKAIEIAAQTAKGAAALLLKNERHPEYEIDKVTTPRGVTISGLNQMEHQGFSSAMIRGIVTSAEKAEKLFSDE
jgi:pyrroline-5-carboxylate reductase